MELEKSEDLKQIEEDWNLIIKKIRDGKAHEISEADTMYLGACTKGSLENNLIVIFLQCKEHFVLRILI